ncbi:unnamed protein product [marine sediment metagenome]|uniref:Uncharacterized protein n=1 Tax=marine sediment metagenome TaxID=412755 RepID=X1D174_9ZZZZ
MRRNIIRVGVCLAMLAMYFPVAGQIEDTTKVDKPKEIERKIKTTYGLDGRESM